MTPASSARLRARRWASTSRSPSVTSSGWATSLQGDLGYSVVNKRAGGARHRSRASGPTLLLMGTSALVGVPLGIGLGVIAAIRQYSGSTTSPTGFSTSFIAIPGFVVGLVLIYFLGANLKLLPTTGMTTLGKPFSFVDLVAPHDHAGDCCWRSPSRRRSRATRAPRCSR